MSGDIQPRKRKAKGKKKAHLEALQREEYEQERLALNTMAYEAEDEILDVKSKSVVNNSHKINGNGGGGGGGGGGEGSGIVAKVIFLILLVALSVVIGLILIELRAGMERASVVPKDDEKAAPEIPTPSLHVDEEEPAPPAEPSAPTIESDILEEDFETLEATPPLEEYLKIVEEVVDVPYEKPEEPAEEGEGEVAGGEPTIVEEVIEVVEEVPVVIVEETVIVDKDEAAAAVDDDSGTDGVTDETEAAVPEEEEEVVEELKEPPVPEEVPLKTEEATRPEVREPEEEAQEAPISEEEVIYTEEVVPSSSVEEVVEEPAISETVGKVDAPIQEEEKPAPEEEDDDDDDSEEEEAQEPDDKDSKDKDDDVEEEEEDAQPEVDNSDDSDEDWSQYGKEGGAGALTDAYLRVESLAEEVLRLDPENSMVNQLAPHLSGVLRAMEEGRTEGLLDTLSHIQVILEDVKKRIEDESSSTPEEEAIEDTKRSPYEKADITSDVDNDLREDLDAAEKIISEGP